MKIENEDIPSVLRIIARAIEEGKLVPDMAMIEEWFNCPSVEGDRRLSVVYRRR